MPDNPSRFDGVGLPVERVSWVDADNFCREVRELTGRPIRLPTEAEWEYACRGGTTTPFFWGEELNGIQANCNGNFPFGGGKKGQFLETTTPVGRYASEFPHPWGLTDVHGNVWEWCSDWYDSGFYRRSAKSDPENRDGPRRHRVLRGGSWGNTAWRCRAAFRRWNIPTLRRPNYGFRLVFNVD